jgi:hypothetical protein
MDKKIHNSIMRRVYYSFALSIATHTMFWRGMFLGAAALLLAQWLHVASIINNFLAIPVGSTPEFVLNSFATAVTHGEVVMALTFLGAGIIGLMCLWQLALAVQGIRETRSR